MTPSQPKVDKNSPHSDETTRQVVKIDPDTLQCLVNEATLTIESIDDPKWHELDYADDLKQAVETAREILRQQ